jgi:hypothetical protein
MAAAPTTEDHAIVIGIRRYGDVAAGWVTNLQGPDNDAAAVADWLRSPTGGRLPAANVRVVRSADVPDPFGASGPEPHQRALIEALDEIAQLPTDRVDGQYAGRRLYVYVSGHGWAQRRDETALVTAEATRSNTLNVLVTSWIDWMYYAAPFKELVLWADTCATRTALTFLQPCRIPERMSPNKASVRMFTAFAAPLGLLAVENQMPDRQWHGAFTYALLQGLKGAAPGDVTSDSLSNYLRNTVKDFMRPEQRSSKTVAVEPAIGKTDPMVFATLPTPTFDVTLRFPQTCAGRLATIFTTRSQPAVAEMVLDGDAEWTVALEAGAYGVEVADLGISKAFEVTGGGVDEPIAVP